MKELPKVFISEPINPKGMEMLEGKVQIVLAPDTRKETARALIKDADAAILRATTIFDSDVIRDGARLKAIVRTGIGVDNVDLQSAGERGIYVCNTPGTNDETVAEHAVAMILAFAKQIMIMDQAVRTQNWKERFSTRQVDIKHKKIGIIGYGNIGVATARFCTSLGMQVLAYDPFVLRADPGVEMTDDLEYLFRESDFVSLHCPSTPLTRNLINRKYLQLMKPGAYLVNTSRGDLVVEADLVEALKEKRIAGAALDVFAEEPLPANSPLLALSNIILSPHVAGSTKESNERIAIAAAEAVLDTLAGKTPRHICNMEHLSLIQKSAFFA